MREELQAEQPQPTMEQLSKELNDWLSARGVTLQVIAIGKRTMSPCAIDDFLPGTHEASVTLVKVVQK